MQIALAPAAFLERLFARPHAADRRKPRLVRMVAVGVPAGTTRGLPQVRKGRTMLHCRSGTAWITRDGELQDIVLQPGDSYPIDSDPRSQDGLRVNAIFGDCALELRTELR